MNYQRQYNLLIAKAQDCGMACGYTERHHIVPRSVGGTDDSSNIVVLTAREHFIAHMLLAKMYGGSQWLSVIRMRGSQSQRYVNARLYAIARQQHAQHLSNARQGTKMSATQKASISKSLRGNQNAKGTMHTAITKAKLSLANKGKTPWNKGKTLPKHSANTLEKMRIARTEHWARRKDALSLVTC
jgi:hypothetical protein